ncbi:hypothetical protein ABZS66_19280 [Dactylosporangium sp. NPDC005572]|uniref:hypothetical protein n=1 Tax=Dactylosporangium sp. NPDC005572 TaxID=3156889 RepID=UPI0033B190E8
MDPTILTALIGTGGTVVGGVITGAVVGRRLRRAQADHLAAQTDVLRQDIYQQVVADLRTELERLQTALRATSAEAERLRLRVLELESRVAQLSQAEAHLAAELRTTQADRDRLRADLAARDATVAELRAQVHHLELQLATQPSTGR